MAVLQTVSGQYFLKYNRLQECRIEKDWQCLVDIAYPTYTEYAIRSVPRFLLAVFMAGWWAETTTAVQPDEKKVTTGT